MKGNNRLELNHETMCQALQLWVDSRFTDPKPLVTSIELKKDGYGSESVFVVKVQDAELSVLLASGH